jgi:hypothetical protein
MLRHQGITSSTTLLRTGTMLNALRFRASMKMAKALLLLVTTESVGGRLHWTPSLTNLCMRARVFVNAHARARACVRECVT